MFIQFVNPIKYGNKSETNVKQFTAVSAFYFTCAERFIQMVNHHRHHQ